VELSAVVRKIFLELASLAKPRGVTFALTVAGGPPGGESRVNVSGERLLLHTMLANCLKNAVEASPEGGLVDVDLSDGQFVTVRVHNQGAVPESIRKTFFRKFATAGKVGGTGLGAYSAKLVAEVHGGAIAMESSEEGGTTITIRLPGLARQVSTAAPKIA
jgi:signal transduction histidine kinase